MEARWVFLMKTEGELDWRNHSAVTKVKGDFLGWFSAE